MPDTDTTTPAARLEAIRASLRAENVSYGELAELASLVPHIAPGDIELLEAAGVPEHPDTDADTATVASVTLTVALTRTFVLDVFANAGAGIRYWTDDHRTDDTAGTYTVWPDADARDYLRARGTLSADGVLLTVTADTLARALTEILAGQHVHAELTGYARTAVLDPDGPDAAEVDADLADCLVQVALFGEVLFA